MKINVKHIYCRSAVRLVALMGHFRESSSVIRLIDSIFPNEFLTHRFQNRETSSFLAKPQRQLAAFRIDSSAGS